MTATTAHTAVTVTARDLMMLLHAEATPLPGTRIDVAPVLVYVARGLTADDLIDADNDSGYGIIGDVEGTVRTSSERAVDDSAGALVTMIDKAELVEALMTETLPQIAARLTGMAREGWWA